MWLKLFLVDFICLKVIKISGVIYMVMVYFMAQATGQAEIAYAYSDHAKIAGLVMIIVARFEETPFALSRIPQWWKNRRKPNAV